MSHPRHHPRGTASSPDADRVKLRLRLPTDGSVDLDKLRATLEAHLQRQAGPGMEPELEFIEQVAKPDPTFVWKFATVILFAGMVMIILITMGGEKTGTGGVLGGVGLILLVVGGWLVWSRMREAKPDEEPFSLRRFVKTHPYLSGTIALAVVVSGTGVGLMLGGYTSVGLVLALVGLLMLGVGIALVVRHQTRKAEELPEPGITAERPPFLSWQWLRQYSKAVVAVAAIPVVAVLVIALMNRETEPAGKTGIAEQPDPVEKTEPAGKTDLSWVLAVAGSGVGLAFLGVGGWLVWRRMRKAKEAGVEAETEPGKEPFSFRRLIKSYPYLFATIGWIVVSLGTGLGILALGGGSMPLIFSAVFCALGLEAILIAKLLALYRDHVVEELGTAEGVITPTKTFPALAAGLMVVLGAGMGTSMMFVLFLVLVAMSVVVLPLLAIPTALSLYWVLTAEERREQKEREGAEFEEPITLWERIFGEPFDEEVGLGRTVAWVKTNPKKTAGAAVAAMALFGGLIMALFYGISSIPTETAQDDPKPEPPVESSETFRPAEGYEGRLAAVLMVGGALGFCGFQLRRKVAKALPSPEARQTAANAVFVDFWPGFRHFIAAQGGFLLVAAATGAVVLIWDTWRLRDFNLREGEFVTYSAWSALAWTLAGMGLAGLLVMAFGAAGINLMPKLDREIKTPTGGSTVMRFAQRKVWHIVLIGLILGAMISVWRVEPIRHWWDLWLKWTLSLGLVAAAFWKQGELGEKVEDVRPLPKETQAKLDHVMMFNLPLLAGFALPMALGLLVLTGLSWLNIGWLAPSAALGLLLVVGLLMKYPRLLRHWQEIIFFPGIVAFICDWLVWGNSFWFVFGGLAALFAFGKVLTQPKDTESGRLLIFPPRRRDYRPVRTWEKDSMEIRWSGLLAMTAFILLTFAAAGKWVWSGTP
jgi:MFS family permease